MNPIAVYICNAVIVLAGIAAVVTGKVTWGEFLMLAAGLLTSTTQVGVTHAKAIVAARRAAKAAQKPPRVPSTLLPPTMLLTIAMTLGACSYLAPAPSPTAPAAGSRPVHGGIIPGGGGGGGSAPPTGTGFITVTGGAQDSTALAFPLSEAKGGTAATSFPGVKGSAVTLSTANYAKAKGYQWLSSDFTAGLAFFAADSGVVVTGVRFYYDAADAAARTIKFSLVDVTGSAVVESITSGSITATTLTTQLFASTHTLTAGKTYAVVARSASSGTYAPFDSGSSAGPKWCSTVACLWKQDGKVAILASPVVYSGGDTPASVANNEAITGRIVPLEPVFQ